jgi:hypothetical protein
MRSLRIKRAVIGGVIGFLSLVIALGAVALLEVRNAERRAVDEAALASREAQRARDAEAEVKAQLQVVQREQAAKRSAQAEARRGKEDLAVVNTQLEDALSRTEAESKRAREAADAARKMADTVQKANAKLEKLLADERARAERLERERRKITNELR